MSEIYQRLAELAMGFRLQGNWNFLPPHATVRCLPRDSGEVLTGLARRSQTQSSKGPDCWCGMRTVKPASANLQTSPRIFVVLADTARGNPLRYL